MNQRLIEQYVAGRMSEAEAEAFEEYCLSNPEFARQVDFEQRLKLGLAEVARGSTAEFVRSNHPMRWNLAAAAAVVVLVIGALFAWQRIVPGRLPVMAAVTTDAERAGPSMRLALVRGSENIAALPPGVVRVEIVGLFDLGVHYIVMLDRLEQSKKVDTIGTLNNQHPSSPVTLEVMVDSDRLAAGSYALRVRKQATSDESLDFEFVKH